MLNNCIDGRIPKKVFLSSIDIVNLADVHFGNKACHKDFFKQVIKNIKTQKSTYWLSTGDILDMNITKSKYFDPTGLDVNTEFNEVCDLLKPIADKCLGFVGSNHSARIHKLTGLNFDQIISKMLGITYLGETGLINCTFHHPLFPNMRLKYMITLTHGQSNGMTLGAKANSVQRLYDMFPNVDVCLEGHTHTFLTTMKEVYNISHSGTQIVPHNVTLCIAGHCLLWPKSYAISNKYPPTPIGFPKISLDGLAKQVNVNLIQP